MWAWLVTSALAADDLEARYLGALAAWRAGDTTAASAESQAILQEDPSFAPARLLYGYTLVRLGALESADDWLLTLADDPEVAATAPEVSALARRYSRRWAERWHRDGVSVGLGLAVTDRRDPVWDEASRVGVLEVGLPVAGPCLLRVSATTPTRTSDALDLYGPVVGASFGADLRLGPGFWAVDASLGPSFWVGRSERTDGAWDGWFPGARGAVGVSARPTRPVGLRAEAAYSAQVGARPGLVEASHGWDVRVLAVGWAG